MIARAVALAAAAVVTSAGAARAERVVGVLDVRGDGVSDVVVARFGEAIEEGLESATGITPAPQVRMKEQLASTAWSVSCLVGACLAEVGVQAGVEWVVTAGLTGAGESYRYTITLLEAATGRVLQQVSETCAACTVDDVASQATLATMGLIDAGDPGVGAAIGAARGRGKHHARTLRRASLAVLGVALVAAGAGAYFTREDDVDVGYPLLGAAGGLAASGVLMLGLSFRF